MRILIRHGINRLYKSVTVSVKIEVNAICCRLARVAYRVRVRAAVNYVLPSSLTVFPPFETTIGPVRNNRVVAAVTVDYIGIIRTFKQVCLFIAVYYVGAAGALDILNVRQGIIARSGSSTCLLMRGIAPQVRSHVEPWLYQSFR